MNDLEAIEAHHVESHRMTHPPRTVFCACGQAKPCDVEALVAEVRVLRERITAAVAWLDAYGPALGNDHAESALRRALGVLSGDETRDDAAN